MPYNPRLTVSCPDRNGLICALSSFISMPDGNILSADQYVSAEGIFFMRLGIGGEGFGLAVRLHLQDRILVDGNRTVVFE